MRTLFIVTLITFIGCGVRHTPSDLPQLHPCAVTVLQDGKPLAGAVVCLQNTDKNVKYAAASGETTAEGIAAIRTYGELGVPEGTYHITLQKTVIEGEETYKDANGKEQLRGGTKYSLVELSLTDAETSPLKMTVKSGKNSETADAGKAVKIEIQKNVFGE